MSSSRILESITDKNKESLERKHTSELDMACNQYYQAYIFLQNNIAESAGKLILKLEGRIDSDYVMPVLNFAIQQIFGTITHDPAYLITTERLNNIIHRSIRFRIDPDYIRKTLVALGLREDEIQLCFKIKTNTADLIDTLVKASTELLTIMEKETIKDDFVSATLLRIFYESSPKQKDTLYEIFQNKILNEEESLLKHDEQDTQATLDEIARLRAAFNSSNSEDEYDSRPKI